MLLQHFDNLLPWKQSKIAAKHNYLKSLKLQSHCMQINFLITFSTNIMLCSLIPRILQLLRFSFILLYCLHFMLVKIIPIIFQINIKLKISPSINHLVKVMISTCIQTPCKLSRLCLYSKQSLRALQLSKSENVRKGT